MAIPTDPLFQWFWGGGTAEKETLGRKLKASTGASTGAPCHYGSKMGTSKIPINLVKGKMVPKIGKRETCSQNPAIPGQSV